MEPYYADNLVTLYHGDCRELAAWLEADVLVTDPPYGIGYESGGLAVNVAAPVRASVEGDSGPELRDEALARWGKRPAVVFGSWRVPRPPGVNHRLIWHKAANCPGPRAVPWYSADEEIYVIGKGFTGKPEQNVLLTHDRRSALGGSVITLGHPTPKPVGLLERLIVKCPPGTVADPFAGVGSTLLAARNLGRRAIGVEIEERYCATIAARLSAGVLDLGEGA